MRACWARSRIGDDFRVINAAVGVVLTGLIYLALVLFARNGAVRRMAIVAAAAALPCAVLLSFASLRVAAAHMTKGPQSSITTQEGVAIVQQGSNIRILRGTGDDLEVNLPMEQIMAAMTPSSPTPMTGISCCRWSAI